MEITRTLFGHTAAGEAVDRFTLTDGAVSASILTLGGVIQSLVVPDKDGAPVDVALGFDCVAAYEAQDCYIGALIGRCANRIAGGRFTLSGRTYQLALNDRGLCHLHGGETGFNLRVWSPSLSANGLTLRYHSPDGEEGYPGALDAAVTYRLEHGALTLEYHATSTQDTLCNLSNHVYFNLAGHASGTVGAQRLRVYASRYTPIGDTGTATGEIAPVIGTKLDLQQAAALGDAWDDPQLANAGGYDHNYMIDGFGQRTFAEAYCPENGIQLTVISDLPAMQLYTGNFLHDKLPTGKGGAVYGRRHGFCLETQFPPNAPGCPAFPQPVLHAGAAYHSRTTYALGTP